MSQFLFLEKFLPTENVQLLNVQLFKGEMITLALYLFLKVFFSYFSIFFIFEGLWVF